MRERTVRPSMGDERAHQEQSATAGQDVAGCANSADLVRVMNSSADATLAERTRLAGHRGDCTALAGRLRQAGIVLVECDTQGELHIARNQSEDWWRSLLCASPIFRKAVREAAVHWNSEDDPALTEIISGLWLSGMPCLNRRRRVGYAVAVIAAHEFVEAEQLSAMCQAAQMDAALTVQRLRSLPMAHRDDVRKLASFARWAFEDQAREGANDETIESMGKQLAESYEIENLLYTLTQNMTVQERPERFVALACSELLSTLPYAWIGLQLGDDRQRLKSMAGRFIVAGQTNQPPDAMRSMTRALLKRAQADTPIVLDPQRNTAHAEFSQLGRTVLVQPLADRHEVIGVLLAGDKRPDESGDTTASNIDLKLLGAAATHITIFLENSALVDDLNAMFIGTLEALTASIDAKDRYTCGHSRRVAHLTQQLARAIGLDEHIVSRCHIAGLVHDVGKIGVPESVLLKPGKLTAQEFAWIRQHPEMGHRILRDIPQLQDVLPGVLYHHERWDGNGYPEGLAGEAIPLLARLIGLADAFDAMSSTRTYRSALSRSQVLREIEKCSGSQFDPHLTSEFTQLDFSEYDRMTAEFATAEGHRGNIKDKAA